MKKVLLVVMFTPIFLLAQKDCKKSFISNEYDEIKKEKKIYTKSTGYSVKFNSAQGISFSSFNNLLTIWLSSSESYALKENSEIGILLDNGTSLLIKFESEAIRRTIASSVVYTNYYFLKNQKEIDNLLENNINSIKQYSGNRSFEVDKKKALKIKERLNCLVSEIGYNNLLTVEKTTDTTSKDYTHPLTSSYTDTSQYTFRETTWGMSMNEVIEKEGNPTTKKVDILMYKNQSIGGKTCTIGYVFSNNKLVRAKYLFEEKHTTKNLYLFDYSDISAILSKKYGASNKEKIVWRNDLYKNNTDDYGMAVAVGHLVKYEKWNLDRTTIIHVINGDNYQINHEVEYSSNQIEETKNDYFDDF